jgi:hypothetical protein
MHPKPRILKSLRRFAAAALALGLGLAQGAAAQSMGPRIPPGQPVTFQTLAAAPFQSSYQKVRVRRFLDTAGNFVQLRENLTLQGDGTNDSAFKLDFVDVVGPGSGDSTSRSRWNEVYRTHGGLLHMHGGFRISDPVVAQQNYQIYDFGAAQRIGRAVRRVVVFPNLIDKGIWLLDLDVETGVALYTAEFDSRLRLINELETTSFQVTGSVVELGARTQKPAWSWRPKQIVERFPDLQSAQSNLGGMTTLQPAIGSIVAEYQQRTVQVTEDPVNGDRTLVLGYSDGVDEFFVLQSQGGGNPFLDNPSIQNINATAAHAIASYDDPAMRAYVFHENGTTFWVVGRGSLERLKGVSFRLCQQAITGS